MSKGWLLAGAFVMLSALAIATPLRAENPCALLRVKVTGIKYKQGGNLVLTLYNSEDSWLVLKKIYAAKKIKVTADVLTIDFESIPYSDTYALFIFHDRNSNDTLDFSWFPFPHPTEGVAVSNNAVRMGEPYYAKARFTVDRAERVTEVKMHY